MKKICDKKTVNEELYRMIFKRKSFHLFRDIQEITTSELEGIAEKWKALTPLADDIATDIRIVPGAETNCSRGEEYCILLYSEKKDGYLQNMGYLGEQLDLYLASLNIGALWFGIGRTEQESYRGLDFVIMIAIAKVSPESFRKDMFKSKRKPLEEIWTGEPAPYAEVARFAPSACNTQPWIVENDGRALKVFRYKAPGKRGIMPADKVSYYNRIDMGIFLLFLELCLTHEGYGFERRLYTDEMEPSPEKTLVAEYVPECVPEYLPAYIGEEAAIQNMNDYTQQFGLTLSEEEAGLLACARRESLKEQQRVEFGGGILEKLMRAFCESAYIYQEIWADTLTRLQDIFYLYKNESMDELTDDELIEVMREAFDGECQGSLEYLEDTCLEDFARKVRAGTHKFFGRYRVDGE